MILRDDLLSLLNSIYDTSIKDYGPNGLQVEGSKDVHKIACAVTADLTTIEKAIELNCQALVVHHGIFWNQKNLTLTGSIKKRIQALLNNNLSLFAYHLPMDMHTSLGNNFKAALDLGWKDIIPSAENLGVIGSIKPTQAEEVYLQIEKYYDTQLSIIKGNSGPFKKLGLISGGGHRYIEDMAAVGVDCFISGTADEPTYSLAMENEISFIKVGHTASEKIGPKAIQEHLQMEHSLDTIYIDSENPF